MRLPRWIVDDAESVRREAAAYRAMTPEERATHLAAACRAAARMLASRPDRERVLAMRDAMPASTLAALARLRREYAGRAGEAASELPARAPAPHGDER